VRNDDERVARAKYQHLILRRYGRHAYREGGQPLLLKVATDVLGTRALAMIGRSATYPTGEFEEATALAGTIGARCVVVTTEETDDIKFRENPPDRCYYCKTELFGKLSALAEAENILIADGTIADDAGDFRPGMRAHAAASLVARAG
jgi:uncharacterized protein